MTHDQDALVVDDNEMVEYIYNEAAKMDLGLSLEQINGVLDLEFTFLKEKGLIEEV